MTRAFPCRMPEILAVVDQNDKVVGSAALEEVYARKLPHRIVLILVFNEKGEMALQLRSKHKSFCPHHWVTAVGGHVRAGETAEQAALREFQEELGTTTIIKQAFKDRYDGWSAPKFLTIFTAIYTGGFDINPLEVEAVEWFSLAKIREMLANNGKLHPELRFILERHYTK